MPRILIVDDDETQRRLLRFRLKEHYEIIDTGSPEDALSLALQHKPDAILLDLTMPRYSGFEICHALSSMSFTELIPVFIVSGQPAGRYKEFCESLGAREYFQKPVDFETLQESLAAVVRRKNTDRRTEPRVRLRVKLTLRGTSPDGKPFECLTATENVSAHGFYSACEVPLNKDQIVEVFLGAAGEQFSGKARVIHVRSSGRPVQGYGFRFVGDPANWVLH